jgi:hypothetical protein
MLDALRQGFRHTAAVPGLLILLWLVNLLIALPAAVLVEESLHDSIKWGDANESLREGFDTGWYGEFSADAKGLAATFEPGQIGVGATLAALDGWWSGKLFELPLPVVAVGIVFACVWLFLLGGVLTRLHSPWDRLRAGEVFAAGREYFPRFLRLGILSAVLYYGVIRLSQWLFPWIGVATRDVTSETTILAYNVLGAGLIVGLFAVIKAVFDYAKISMVVGGRRSALSAAFHGLGFVLRRPLATGGLVAIFSILTVLLVAVYSQVAPGADQRSITTILLALAASQLFLLLRVALRLSLLGSELALFERHD